MADEVRSTQYLYEFAVKGAADAEQQFRSFLSNIKQYEADLQASLANIDRAMQSGLSGSSATGRGGTDFQARIEQETAAIQRSVQVKRELEQQNARLISPSASAATGVPTTDIPPWLKGEGTEGLKAFSEQLREGRLEVGTFEKALGDSSNTVEKGSIYFGKLGQEIGRTVTVTKTGADGIRTMTTSITGLNQEMSKTGFFGEQMLKHLKWISQGILLWGAINAVTDALRGWWDAQTQLNASLAEFEMRTGASAQGMAEYEQGILEISQRTATRPSEIAAVAPYAPDLATMDYAAQLNKVAGGDMQNQMQWLVAQQRQFNVHGDDTIRILNAMASGWQLTTLPMGQFVTMLRDAAPLAQEFGLGMEDMYALMGAMQSVTAAEGRELDYLSRNLTRLYEPDVQQSLQIRTAGITEGGELIKKDMIEVLDMLNNKIQDGELSFDHLSEVMGASGRRQRQLLKGVVMGWDTVYESMQRATMDGANFSDMHNIKLETTQVKLDALGAAWESLMTQIGDSSGFIKFLDVVTNSLNAWVGNIQMFRQLLGELPSIEIPAWLMAIPGIGPLVGAGKIFGEVIGSNEASAQASVGARQPNLFGAAANARATTDLSGTQSRLGSWPSMFTIPEGGGDLASLQRSMDQWTNAFSSLGPAFSEWVAQNQDQALIYDENTKTLRLITGFLPALQRAISENTQAQKMQDIQPNLRNVDLNLDESGGQLQQWVQYYTQFLTRMGFPQESKPQLLLGEDDTWIRMWASNEALMLAIRALTEATEDQTDVLSGMWNVPEGATMWVPIQSLFYSRQQEKSTPGIGMLPTPPTTLPPQQGDWMNLPGAVSQMTVGDMTVMNWEGLMTTVPADVVAEPEKPAMDPELFKSIMGTLRELDIRKSLGWVTAKENVEWGDRSPGYINIFEEAAGKGLSATTLEVQSPVTEITTPTAQETIASASIMSTLTSMIAGDVLLNPGSLQGLPTTDTSGMEGILQSMAVTLVMIYNALQTSTPAPIPTYPTNPGGGGVQEFAAVSVDELGRYVDQRNYYTFVQKARMRYF